MPGVRYCYRKKTSCFCGNSIERYCSYFFCLY
nr:MAG TPA: hypothetical protein [Caudoviricetes sp.]